MTPSVTCRGRGIRKPTGQGRNSRSFRIMDEAMTTACETSEPLIPARMLMLFVQKVDSRAIYI